MSWLFAALEGAPRTRRHRLMSGSAYSRHVHPLWSFAIAPSVLGDLPVWFPGAPNGPSRMSFTIRRMQRQGQLITIHPNTFIASVRSVWLALRPSERKTVTTPRLKSKLATTLAAACIVALAATAHATGDCNIPTDNPDADTATCLAKIDGRTIVNGRCQIGMARTGKEIFAKADKYLVTLETPTNKPTTAFWNRGDGTENLVTLGRIGEDSCCHSSKKWWVWETRNRRFYMRLSDFLKCPER
jgi:hypothetical protein